MKKFPHDFNTAGLSQKPVKDMVTLETARMQIYEQFTKYPNKNYVMVQCGPLGEEDQKTLEQELMDAFPECVCARQEGFNSGNYFIDQWVKLELLTKRPSRASEYRIRYIK